MTTPTAPAPSVAGPAPVEFGLDYVLGKLEADCVEDDGVTDIECRWCRYAIETGRHHSECAVSVVKDIIQDRDECAAIAARTPANPTPPVEAEGMFENPRPATCPQCSGALRDTGPNQGNDLRFVECAACNVCWTVTTALAATPPVEAEARGYARLERAKELAGQVEAKAKEAHGYADGFSGEGMRFYRDQARMLEGIASALRALAAAPQGVGDGGGLLGEAMELLRTMTTFLSCDRRFDAWRAATALLARYDALTTTEREAGCLGCAKVARHPGEGYECALHPSTTEREGGAPEVPVCPHCGTPWEMHDCELATEPPPTAGGDLGAAKGEGADGVYRAGWLAAADYVEDDTAVNLARSLPDYQRDIVARLRSAATPPTPKEPG